MSFWQHLSSYTFLFFWTISCWLNKLWSHVILLLLYQYSIASMYCTVVSIISIFFVVVVLVVVVILHVTSNSIFALIVSHTINAFHSSAWRPSCFLPPHICRGMAVIPTGLGLMHGGRFTYSIKRTLAQARAHPFWFTKRQSHTDEWPHLCLYIHAQVLDWIPPQMERGKPRRGEAEGSAPLHPPPIPPHPAKSKINKWFLSEHNLLNP